MTLQMKSQFQAKLVLSSTMTFLVMNHFKLLTSPIDTQYKSTIKLRFNKSEGIINLTLSFNAPSEYALPNLYNYLTRTQVPYDLNSSYITLPVFYPGLQQKKVLLVKVHNFHNDPVNFIMYAKLWSNSI